MPARQTVRPPPPLPVRLAACALALSLAFAGAARAQDEDDGDDQGGAAPIVVEIDGPCALTVKGQTIPCRGVAYMVFPGNRRIAFTAITDTAGWAFSGEDDSNRDGRYALDLDSMLDPASGRFDADGRCEMQVGEDRRTVRSLDCRASTKDGEFTLEASGTIAVVDTGDEDDDGAPDDGGESGSS